jgi:ethanolamine ammonia-lyase small subunit
MDDVKLAAIVEAVVKELLAAGAISAPATSPAPVAQQPVAASAIPTSGPALTIDLPDPTTPAARYAPGVKQPSDPDGLRALIAATTARIGVGRAGPRYTTASLLLFQADHAITQDALYRDVDPSACWTSWAVRRGDAHHRRQAGVSAASRPGPPACRRGEAHNSERCAKNPSVQLVVGDGLSAAAIEANLRQILPVVKQGVQAAGLSFGVPFFVKHCRVGVMNDIGDLVQPEVLILLIGERPGLGRADSMSAYMAYRPKPGDTDADRDVICNIFEGGGTNPLEAGAFVVQLAQKMRSHQASGNHVKLKLAT